MTRLNRPIVFVSVEWLGLCVLEYLHCTLLILLTTSLHKSNTYGIDDQFISELQYKKLKEMLKCLSQWVPKGYQAPSTWVE